MYKENEPSQEKFLNDLLKSINGEFSAVYYYEKLANLAPNQQVQKQILEIRNDEIRHYQEFCNLYTSLTGQQPYPQIIEDMPTNFSSGVLNSFIDEQKTTDFYHQIGRHTDNPFICELFRTNAADEQNHAVWFLFFLTNLNNTSNHQHN